VTRVRLKRLPSNFPRMNSLSKKDSSTNPMSFEYIISRVKPPSMMQKYQPLPPNQLHKYSSLTSFEEVSGNSSTGTIESINIPEDTSRRDSLFNAISSVSLPSNPTALHQPQNNFNSTTAIPLDIQSREYLDDRTETIMKRRRNTESAQRYRNALI
jgi:hypothetical protein